MIASIFITLTAINNETHYVPKKIKKTKNKTKTKQEKTKKSAPIEFVSMLL
jgi:hypothetical protein